MTKLNLSPADSKVFEPAQGSLAFAVRRLAGSSFRMFQWSSDERDCAAQCAQFAVRVGFPLDRNSTLGVTIGATPRSGRTLDYTPHLPSRLLRAAVALATAEGCSAQPYIDRAFDLLAGLCGVRGCSAPIMLGGVSEHGFGFTMPPLSRPTEHRMRAAFRADVHAQREKTGLNRVQSRNTQMALRVLALQFVQEANDPQMNPLDRARRAAAAARLLPAALAIGFGNDETGEALALYARDCGATDDGAEAWARFASDNDRASEAVNETAQPVECDAADSANANDDGDQAGDASAFENDIDQASRLRDAARAAKRATDSPARSEKAKRDREADEAHSLAAAAAHDCTNIVADDGGVNVGKSLTLNRAKLTIS